MLRRTALTGIAALALTPSLALAQASPTILSGAAREAGIRDANRMLNAAQRLQGRFTQQNPDGSQAAGRFYMERPGRLRFEYDPPATMLIVSNGRTVTLRDSALRTTDRIALRSTPLDLILRDNIHLSRNARVLRVSEYDDWLMVTVRDRYGQSDGQLTLQFWRPANELRSWDVTDATGARTRTTLSDVTTPAALDQRLFQIE